MQSVMTNSARIQQPAASPYFDNRFGCDAVKLLPGDFFATATDTLLVTVLGSCVSVCLRDGKNGIGGMNHFLLPMDSPNHLDEYSQSARYGMYAMELLINEMMKQGAQRRNLQAKVFGGGRVMENIKFSNVGEKNAQFVREYLDTEHIPIVAEDLLDIYPRKVYFFARTGKVLVKKIRKLHNNTIFDRESDYRSRIRRSQQSASTDDILF